MNKTCKILVVAAVMLFIITSMLCGDVLLEEGFELMFPPFGWTSYTSGSVEWTQSSSAAYSGSYGAAAIRPYNISAQVWLITPGIDLTGYPVVCLDYWEKNVTAPPVPGFTAKTMISTDYSGSGDPSTATWTTLVSETSTSWSERTIDLSSYSGTVYIAFSFVSLSCSCYLDDVRIVAGELPIAPVALAPTTNGTLTFSANWEASADTTVTGYRLQIAKDSLFTSDVDTYTLGDILTCQVTLNSTNFCEGGDRWYRVNAKNDIGYGDYSNVIKYDAPDSKPVATAATKTGTMTFYANWEASTDTTVTGYYINVGTYRGYTGSNYYVGDFVSGYGYLYVGDVLTYPITVDSTVDYYYSVYATNGIGCTGCSNVIECNLLPDAPVAMEATKTGTMTFYANWDASTDSTIVNGYYLDIASDDEFTTFVNGYENLDVGNVLTYPVTVDSTIDYYYRVRAYCNIGAGENSNTTTCNVLPDAPVATDATTNGTLTFYANWDAGADSAFVNGYYLDVATDEEFTSFVTGYEDLDVGNVVTYSVTVSEATTHYYRVRAYCNIGTGENSNTMTCNIVPDAPVATDATTTGTLTFYANWEASADSTIVNGYRLDVFTDRFLTNYLSGYEDLDVGNVLTYPVTVSEIGDYYYRVRAYCDAGSGANSNVISVTISITGDFNSDGYVDASDLQLLGDHWHYVDTDTDWDALYDLDPDGIIDAADLQIFGDHWHEGTPPEVVKGDGPKGPNADAGIVFDLNATTAGNQNLTHIDSQAAGTYIRLDVYATGVHNLDTFEFEVVYDSTELEYISSAADNPITFEQNILSLDSGTPVGWMVDNSTPGILSIAYTLTGTDTTQAPEGEGLLADIVFKALVNTHGELSFGAVTYYDSDCVADVITDTGTATLPVELSAFTAVYNADYTTLSWTTASETDILGFNVYRSTEDEFDTSKKLNADIIAGHGTTTEMNTYDFVDLDQLNINTTYYYWLESIEYGGINTVYTSIELTPEEGSGGYVEDFDTNSLSNFPNPVTNSTTILYSVKGMLKSQSVEINIYNMLGQLIDTVEGKNGTATWNTSDHATGIYFYKLNTDSYTEIKKMMVTK